MPKKEKAEKSKATLIITEKPQAASKIAAALSDGKDEEIKNNGVSYYEFEKDKKKYFVGCAVGHLFGISQKLGKKKEIPDFDVEWRPNYENKNMEYTKRYYDTLKRLSKKTGDIINACDYDVEGEVIGLNVVRFICGQKDAKRMKFSSLTKDELKEAFENVSSTLNWGQAIAGETRHYLDWFYGINLSRELMKAISSTGSFKILSIGRVQGPSLAMLTEKEKQIKEFKSEPYWQVFLLVQDLNKQKIEVQYPKDLKEKKELLKFKQLQGKKAQAKTEIKDEKINPPAPFDLTTLQTESYRWNGLTPTQTLQIAQGLYLDGIISYPRTSSQKLPEAIGYDKILKQLGKHYSFTDLAINKKPIEGKKSDPAHPAIYPTGEWKQMNEQEKKVYDLIVRRFIACFCAPALIEDKKIEVSVNDLKFYAKGIVIKEKNWMAVYKNDTKDVKIPTMNGEVEIKEIRIEEKMTQPPKRFTEASLIRELERKGLGTKSTRASIIETLYDRGYAKERSIEVTPLGMTLVQSLNKYSPIILDEKLTREIEKEMGTIQTAKKDLNKKQEKIINTAKKAIVKIIEDMENNEKKIGEELKDAVLELRKEEQEANTLNKCPVCKKGNLRILFNKNFRRYFLGCSNYPECKTTFSLPPNALIKPALKDGQNELCEFCNFPLLIAIRKAKRPWKFCFNPNCKSNEEWRAKSLALKKEYDKQTSLREKKKEEKKEEKEK